MADSSQVGDIGTKIILDCVEDISTATDKKIMFKKADGVTIGEWAAEIEGTSVYYITVDGDLDQAGDWCLQAYVLLSGGWEGKGEKYCYTVSKNCA